MICNGCTRDGSGSLLRGVPDGKAALKLKQTARRRAVANAGGGDVPK